MSILDVWDHSSANRRDLRHSLCSPRSLVFIKMVQGCKRNIVKSVTGLSNLGNKSWNFRIGVYN